MENVKKKHVSDEVYITVRLWGEVWLCGQKELWGGSVPVHYNTGWADQDGYWPVGTVQTYHVSNEYSERYRAIHSSPIPICSFPRFRKIVQIVMLSFELEHCWQMCGKLRVIFHISIFSIFPPRWDYSWLSFTSMAPSSTTSRTREDSRDRPPGEVNTSDWPPAQIYPQICPLHEASLQQRQRGLQPSVRVPEDIRGGSVQPLLQPPGLS